MGFVRHNSSPTARPPWTCAGSRPPAQTRSQRATGQVRSHRKTKPRSFLLCGTKSKALLFPFFFQEVTMHLQSPRSPRLHPIKTHLPGLWKMLSGSSGMQIPRLSALMQTSLGNMYVDFSIVFLPCSLSAISCWFATNFFFFFFYSQEIDGNALLLLKSDMIMKYLGLKLGPALKLCYHIDKLKQTKFWKPATIFSPPWIQQYIWNIQVCESMGGRCLTSFSIPPEVRSITNFLCHK